MSPDEVLTAPTGEFRGRSINGMAQIGLSQGLKIVIQFVSVIALSRLLKPGDFGLVAMVAPLSAFVVMFQDLGLTQAVVTSRALTHGQASTMFWLNVSIATAMAVLLTTISPLVATFYGRPEIKWLVVALAGMVIISGFTAQQTAMLNRNLRFGVLASLDAISVVLTLAGSVTFALIYPSPWALLFGTLLSALTSLIGGWITSGWQPGRPQSLSTISEMLKIGGGLTGFNLLNFFVRNLDNILIGRKYGAVDLGFYDRAYKLLLFPLQTITRPVGRVMTPVLARMRDEPSRYKHAYLRTIQLLMLAIMPLVATLLVRSHELFAWLVGPRWIPAAPIFTWLAVSGLHQAFSTTFGWLYITQARTGEWSRWGVINSALVVSAFFIGLPWGAIGVARAYALTDTFLLLPILIYLTGRSGPVSSVSIVRTVLPYGLCAGLAIIALMAIPLFAHLSYVQLLTVSVIASYVIFVGVLAVFPASRLILGEAFKSVEHVALGVARKFRQGVV